MKPKLKLPPELESFIEAGNTTFSCDDGDWDLRITRREDSPFRDELPSGSVMIAENGCGDCLFLKKSAGGKVNTRVFVFCHEEERCEAFADHVKQLTTPSEHVPLDAGTPGLVPTMLVGELEAALNSTDRQIRNDAIRKFAKTDFGIDALPVLRKALDDDDVQVVLTAAECIGKLGPEAASCPAGQATSCQGVNLYSQLILAGSKVWSYSMCANCYSTCLNALVKLEVDGDVIVEFVQSHIGLDCPDDLIDSLNALKAVGSPEALSILKRAAAFWLPELNMKYSKEVHKILREAKVKTRRA